MNVQPISDTHFEAKKQVKASQIERLSSEVLSQLPTELSIESKNWLRKLTTLLKILG